MCCTQFLDFSSSFFFLNSPHKCFCFLHACRLSPMTGFLHHPRLWNGQKTLTKNQWFQSYHHAITSHEFKALLRLAYPVLEKQFHRPWPWLHSNRLKTRLKSRYRWRLSTSGSFQIRCSAERTLVRTISNTWVTDKMKKRGEKKRINSGKFLSLLSPYN